MCGKYTTIIIIGRRGLNIKVLWNTQNRPTTTMVELFGSHRTEASVFGKFSSVRSTTARGVECSFSSKLNLEVKLVNSPYLQLENTTYLCIDSNLTFLS